MDVFTAVCLIAGLTGGLGLVCWIIAADTQRFLARFELSQWREPYYLRALPNFLQALHDNHFASPWPTRKTPFRQLFSDFVRVLS